MSLNATLTVLKGKINRVPSVDVTLTKEGWAADAKETGEQLRQISGAGELSANAVTKALEAEEIASEAKTIAQQASSEVAELDSEIGIWKVVASTARDTADAAMPLAGGTFTGNVKANSGDRSGLYLRNIRVSKDGVLMATDYIAMIRK